MTAKKVSEDDVIKVVLNGESRDNKFISSKIII